MDSTVATHVQVLSTSTLSEILDDLCIRFLIFLPEEELSSIEIEEAHWFYEDFICEINPGVPNLHLRQFIHQLLNHVPHSLISHIPLWKTETAFTEFMSYKTRVPVRGVIMLNVGMDKAVLVKGWKSGASWSFPRGKIDQNEDDRDCAIRETYEETGFDLTGMVGSKDKIDINIREQDMRLYIAPGVPEDFEFAPRTRKEISKIAWHKLSELPGYSVKKGQREQNNIRSGKFFLVAPFIRELRKWISTNGKLWLEQQQGAAVSIQKQVASAAQNLELGEARLKAEGSSNSPPKPSPTVVQPDDSAASLKNLLGIPTQPEAPAMAVAQDDASRRLREMIGGISQPQPPAPPVTNGSNRGAPLSQNPNAEMLLSILQNKQPFQPSDPTTSSHYSPPSHRVSAHPNFMGFPPTGNQNQLPNSSNPLQHPPPHPLQTQPSFGPMLQNAQVQMPSPVGWQQGPQQQRINTFPLPSPPPYPQPQHEQQQQRGATFPMNQFFASPPMVPPGMQMPQQGNMVPQHGSLMVGNPMPQHFGQQVNRGPASPVDAFHPPPPQQQTRRQDPVQAGALLSILKGTRTPVQTPPVSNWQPEPKTTAEMPREPPPPQQIMQPQLLQQSQQTSQPQLPQQAPQPSSPLNNPMTPPPPPRRAVPASGSAPLLSPPPRRPKARTSARNSPQRQQSQRHRTYVATNNRSSTTAPVPQAYPPPPRPTTTQPRHHTPPPPLRHGTPVAIDHYGAQKSTALPTTSFDRRESVSGEHAQTLLAMFRDPQAAAPRMPLDEAVMSNPEMELRKPVQRPPPSLSTPGAGALPARPGLARTPTGSAKANLLAYLEGVASERNDGGGGGGGGGGGVPLS